MAEYDVDIYKFTVEQIDKMLTELGTQSLIDGDKARDQLLDLRSFFFNMLPAPGEVVADAG